MRLNWREVPEEADEPRWWLDRLEIPEPPKRDHELNESSLLKGVLLRIPAALVGEMDSQTVRQVLVGVYLIPSARIQPILRKICVHPHLKTSDPVRHAFIAVLLAWHVNNGFWRPFQRVAVNMEIS